MTQVSPLEYFWDVFEYSIYKILKHATCMCVQLCPTLCGSARLLCLWFFSGKNTGVGCNFFLQGIFPTQGSNLHFLPSQVYSLPLSHQVSPRQVEYFSKFGVYDAL